MSPVFTFSRAAKILGLAIKQEQPRSYAKNLGIGNKNTVNEIFWKFPAKATRINSKFVLPRSEKFGKLLMDCILFTDSIQPPSDIFGICE
jgi:hypothetical protein